MAAQKYKQRDGIQSQQEEDVKALYPAIRFKPPVLQYTMHHEYNPDFFLGYNAQGIPHYLECKEYMTLKDCPKYEAVLACNPNIQICFLIKSASTKVFQRLQRAGFDTHLGEIILPERWLGMSQCK